MKFVVNMILALCFAIGLAGIFLNLREKTHELNMAQAQTATVLGDSIGEMAKAMETMALANIELSKTNQQQVELLKQQHNDYVNITNDSLFTLKTILVFILSFIVGIIIFFILAYFSIKKGYF